VGIGSAREGHTTVLEDWRRSDSDVLSSREAIDCSHCMIMQDIRPATPHQHRLRIGLTRQSLRIEPRVVTSYWVDAAAT
jgi:hypothetical protein